MFKDKKNVILLIALAFMGLVLTLYLLYSEYFTLEFFRSNKELVTLQYQEHTLLFLLIVFLMFLLSSCAPVPIASTLSIVCGALMGVTNGVLFVSFTTALSATIAFLIARYVFRRSIQQRYTNQLELLLARIEPDDFLHATSIRLLPFLPFFSVNYAMSLSSISTFRFYLSTQLGMLLFIVLLVNAGSQVEQIESIGQLFTPAVLLSALALIVTPMLIRTTYRKFT